MATALQTYMQGNLKIKGGTLAAASHDTEYSHLSSAIHPHHWSLLPVQRLMAQENFVIVKVKFLKTSHEGDHESHPVCGAKLLPSHRS